MLQHWISDNWIEVFGAVAGIIYVFLEIRQNIWLWPVGIITSAVYIWVFFSSKFYADMSLQAYYLVISVAGWYWWVKGGSRIADSTEGNQRDDRQINKKAEQFSNSFHIDEGQGDVKLAVSHIKFRTGLILAGAFVFLYFTLWLILSSLTDSPVPSADSFITSLSIVATWMLARKIYEHWYLWIIVNIASMILFIARGLLPTVFLYFVYLIMSFAGLKAWNRSMNN